MSNASKEYIEQLKKQLNDYKEDPKDQKNLPRSGEDLLKKYFVPRDNKETFRIILDKNQKKPIIEAYFHTVTLNTSEGKRHGKPIYCIARNNPFVKKLDENGKPIKDQNGNYVKVPQVCPFCEHAKKLLKTQDSSVRGKRKEDLTEKELEIFEENKNIFIEAKKWEARKFYIIKGIDRGKIKDGVKFWRFKHKYRNQGEFDKLNPVLVEYMDEYGYPYFDPENGCDLSITMGDAEFNGRTYRTVTAITSKRPSKLHEDPHVVKQWINDDISWRDVFKEKKAPNITASEYMEMVIKGNDPYWDDSDPKNKKWRFPGNPDLEEKANTRDRNLDATNYNYDNYRQANDIGQNTNEPEQVMDVGSGLKENDDNKKDEKVSKKSVDIEKDEDLEETEDVNENEEEDEHEDQYADVDADFDEDLPF